MSFSGELQFALAVAVIISALLAMLMVVLIFWQTRQTSGMLSDTRKYYEFEMRELTRKMTATREGWEDANHLVLSGQRSQRGQSYEMQYFNPAEVPIFADQGLLTEDLSIEPDLVFVLAPVLSQEDEAYAVVQEVCESLNLTAVRADLEEIPGDILRRIVALIARARVIVANVSTRNANVYYELGIAHALGKPTILISKNLETVSFDIKANRVIIYSDEAQLYNRLREAIDSTIRPPRR